MMLQVPLSRVHAKVNIFAVFAVPQNFDVLPKPSQEHVKTWLSFVQKYGLREIRLQDLKQRRPTINMEKSFPTESRNVH